MSRGSKGKQPKRSTPAQGSSPSGGPSATPKADSKAEGQIRALNATFTNFNKGLDARIESRVTSALRSVEATGRSSTGREWAKFMCWAVTLAALAAVQICTNFSPPGSVMSSEVGGDLPGTDPGTVTVLSSDSMNWLNIDFRTTALMSMEAAPQYMLSMVVPDDAAYYRPMGDEASGDDCEGSEMIFLKFDGSARSAKYTLRVKDPNFTLLLPEREGGRFDVEKLVDEAPEPIITPDANFAPECAESADCIGIDLGAPCFMRQTAEVGHFSQRLTIVANPISPTAVISGPYATQRLPRVTSVGPYEFPDADFPCVAEPDTSCALYVAAGMKTSVALYDKTGQMASTSLAQQRGEMANDALPYLLGGSPLVSYEDLASSKRYQQVRDALLVLSSLVAVPFAASLTKAIKASRKTKAQPGA